MSEHPLKINKEQESERELKENKKEGVNFIDLFNQRLASVPVLSKEAGANRAWWYGIKGVAQVKRDLPALIFIRYNEDYSEPPELGVWVATKQLKGEGFKHDVLYDELNSFRRKNGLKECKPFRYISSYLVEDAEDKRYLYFEPTPAENLSNREVYNEEWQQFEELAEKYGVTAFVKSSHEVDKTVIRTSGWVEKNRVENYLMALAKKYQMTNSEFLRLRTIYLAAMEGKEKEAKEGDKDYKSRKGYVVPPFDIEAVAQEIVVDRERS